MAGAATAAVLGVSGCSSQEELAFDQARERVNTQAVNVQEFLGDWARARPSSTTSAQVRSAVEYQYGTTSDNWMLLEVRDAPSGTEVDVSLRATGESGGGGFYAQQSLRTCLRLTLRTGQDGGVSAMKLTCPPLGETTWDGRVNADVELDEESLR
ncbi:hypothetical protein V6K52_02955 [Knoellia sp. S7-12]|uniref:hypothetical protein n=1 Tax=Knoellia sp. S7-12 TaxID=3126698 RepID=UPI0033679C43